MKTMQPKAPKQLTLAKQTIKDMHVRTNVRAGQVQTVSCYPNHCYKK